MIGAPGKNLRCQGVHVQVARKLRQDAGQMCVQDSCLSHSLGGAKESESGTWREACRWRCGCQDLLVSQGLPPWNRSSACFVLRTVGPL